MDNVTEYSGNLFDSKADVIGHGVNCEGVMGSGIAKAFRELYPHNYRIYRDFCDADSRAWIGGWSIMTNQDGRMIVNIASQRHQGRNGNYGLLSEGLYGTLNKMEFAGLTSLALPRIGAGIGGLQWPKVKQIIRDAASLYPSISIELVTWSEND